MDFKGIHSLNRKGSQLNVVFFAIIGNKNNKKNDKTINIILTLLCKCDIINSIRKNYKKGKAQDIVPR